MKNKNDYQLHAFALECKTRGNTSALHNHPKTREARIVKKQAVKKSALVLLFSIFFGV